MLDTLVTVIHCFFVCPMLIIIVLLQQGKGADMGATFGGGSNTVFGASGADNLLTRVTTVLAVVFMCTSLYLAVSMRPSNALSGSVLSGSVVTGTTTPTAPAVTGETASPVTTEAVTTEAPPADAVPAAPVVPAPVVDVAPAVPAGDVAQPAAGQ